VSQFLAGRLLIACMVILLAVPGYAQKVSSPSSSTPSLERKIELLIRSRFSVPPEYSIVLGARGKSNTEGFEVQPVAFINGNKRTSVDFLVSKDGSTLARFERFDLDNNPDLFIDVEKRPSRGDSAAKVEIINFDDMECPFCGMLNNEILPTTLDHYRGLVKVVYRDYPLPGHPWALHAAIDANCLADQSASAYWSYVDYAHHHGQDITGADPNPAKSFVDLDNIAGTFGSESIGIDKNQLAMCLKGQDASLVNQSLKTSASLGVDATPQMFVDGERLPSGAQPTNRLWPAIDRALRARGVQPPTIKAPRVDNP
jgi:protein-disulfide isomerase